MRKKIAANPKTNLAVSVTVISDEDATVALTSMLGAHYTAELIQQTGSTKRDKGDVYNVEIATDLAVGRALVALGWDMIRRGSTAVNEAMKERSEERVEAGLRKIQRRVRGEDSRQLLPLDEIMERYGLVAAQRAAERRGVEYAPQVFKQARP